MPVNQERVGVGADFLAATLIASPTSVVANVSPKPKTLFKLEKAISLMCCLTPCRHSDGSVAKRIPTSAKASLSSSLR